MDSHGFSDPIPVPDAAIPTWEVEVIRLKGDVIVGQLIVNHNTLPPRRGGKAKAIVWKLPDDASILPRFGEHEKKRLWELFKEVKKERRRQSKQQPPPQQQHHPSRESSVESAPVGPDNSSRALHSTRLASSPTDDEDFDAEIIELDDDDNDPSSSRNVVVATKTNKKKKKAAQKTGASVHNKNTMIDSPSSCTEVPLSRAPPVAAESPAPVVDDPPRRLAPPPGFLAPVVVVDDHYSGAPHIQTTPKQDQVLSPSSLLYFTPEVIVSANDANNNNASAYSLGRAVVQTFVATIGGDNNSGLSATTAAWLAHYHPNAVKSLLVGTAQVTVRTSVERQEQWEAMVCRRPKNSNSNTGDNHNNGVTSCITWDVTGWTSHEVIHHNNINSQETTAPTLVVLTGTTQQTTGRFAFTLSLVLTAVIPGEDPVVTVCGRRYYSITNDALTLFKI
jgi:hypothetical protein